MPIAVKSPPAGATPRTFIAKSLNYLDCDVILRLTRKRGSIPISNVTVAVFPDFSAEVQKKRAQFTEAKRQLLVHHLPYAILFPARLSVVSEGRVQF